MPLKPYLRQAILYLLSYCFLSSLASAQITVNVPALKDNTLIENSDGLRSNGAGQNIFAGRTNQNQNSIRRGLVAFDLASAVPADAQILDAVFHISLTQNNNGTQTVSLHRVLADWGEGASISPGNGGQGDTSRVNDATWIHTFYDSLFWNTPGGDFDTLAADSITITDSPGIYSFTSSTRMTEIVQFWVSNPDSNFGWLIQGNEGAGGTSVRFGSKEDTIAANHPQLEVTYALLTDIATEPSDRPFTFELQQNYPNPFNPGTAIRFSNIKEQHMKLSIYSLLGEEIETLLNGVVSPGSHQIIWRPQHIPGGIYFYRIETGAGAQTRKMIYLK